MPVDFELHGCPINKHQLLEVISAHLAQPPPARALPQRLRGVQAAGNVCVMVAHGTPCLGPVTHAGCGALCPSYDRGCYGCFGPKETPNPASLMDRLDRRSTTATWSAIYRTFNAGRGALPAGEREP